jgi:ABC-type nitrate/sulfonate/bicarbonate transport system substrate-binding protein
VLHIGFLNLSSHTTLLELCEKDPFLSSHLLPVKTGSTRRIARGIIKGWLDGGILPLPFAHVLARWQKGICVLASVRNTGSALVTPGATPLSDFRDLAGKRVLFSCIGSMEYLLAHRLFQECGLSLSPDAGPDGILAEQMAPDLIPDALRHNPDGSIGAAVLEEPALSEMLRDGHTSQLMHCRDLWPEYTGAVFVARNTDDPARKRLLDNLAEALINARPNPSATAHAPTLHPPCRADFLTTGRYLDSQQLSPMIASLL